MLSGPNKQDSLTTKEKKGGKKQKGLGGGKTERKEREKQRKIRKGGKRERGERKQKEWRNGCRVEHQKNSLVE